MTTATQTQAKSSTISRFVFPTIATLSFIALSVALLVFGKFNMGGSDLSARIEALIFFGVMSMLWFCIVFVIRSTLKLETSTFQLAITYWLAFCSTLSTAGTVDFMFSAPEVLTWARALWTLFLSAFTIATIAFSIFMLASPEKK